MTEWLDGSDHTHGTVGFEQLEVRREVVVDRYGIEQKVKGPSLFGQGRGIGRVGAQDLIELRADGRRSPFRSEVVIMVACAPRARPNLTPMWPRPPKPNDPNLLTGADIPVSQGRVGGDSSAEQWERRPGRLRNCRNAENKGFFGYHAGGVSPIGKAARVCGC